MGNITLKQQTKLNKLARKIISKNQYLSLATADISGSPWISPVVYVCDESYNFYFLSMPKSNHCQNIKIRKNIAFSIFDSHQKWGQGVGLQIKGEAKVLNLKESLKPSKIYALKKYPYGGINTKVAYQFVKNLVKAKKLYRFYQITPAKIWMNNPYAQIDERVEINLN